MSEVISRYIERGIEEDLSRKMVFVAGPRQVGKTTFAKHLLEKEVLPLKDRYMNWDASEDRENIIQERFPINEGLLVLDEIHRYPRACPGS